MRTPAVRIGGSRRVGLLLVLVAAALAGCAGPPWSMGSPLDGRPSIPAGVAFSTANQRRAEVVEARGGGRTVLELRALGALEAAERLSAAERDRLFDLLVQRADEFNGLGRAIPRCEDLRRAAELAPKRGKGLQMIRAHAERDAGDAWLGIGDRTRAADAYRRADALGSLDLSFRLMATREDAAPEVLPVPDLAQAIEVLPLRAVPRFAAAYVAAGGEHLPTLERSLAAARQEGQGRLGADVRRVIARVTEVAAAEAAEADATVTGSVAGTAGAVRPDGQATAVIKTAAPAAPLPPDFDRWVLTGAALSSRLLPLLPTHPELMESEARVRFWVELLLAEDPGSPAALETAALADGLAGRFGGTERRLMDLVYHSPDRYQGMVAAATIWERVGRARDACVQRVRAARWRDDPEDPIWRAVIACTRRDPGAGDWRGIREYVLEKAAPERRAAVAASLDAPEGRLASERDQATTRDR